MVCKQKKIPPIISKQYKNNYVAKDIFKLNEIAKYPKETKHIVIYKSKEAAIISILNWGIRCKWFKNKKDALANAKYFIDNYEQYLIFWKKLKKTNPDYIQLINYEKLCKKTSVIKASLNKLGLKTKNISENLIFNEVPHSSASRIKYISPSDIKLGKNN
jgi:hypothetical protein